jgi:Phosphotransferase enzyme family
MTRLATSYSTIEWSADGLFVTKSRPSSADSRRRFRNELRVNRLLIACPGIVTTPAFVDASVQHRQLTFEAVQGETLGPKYPSALSTQTIGEIVELSQSVKRFSPRRRWFHRLDPHVRIRMATRAGFLTNVQGAQMLAELRVAPLNLRFAHGDVTARNVMTSPTGLMLIDWEWAGLYPQDYDLAFFWFSLIDVDEGRQNLERIIGVPSRSFLLSALLIQLWHLQWFVSEPFKPKHLESRDQLLLRLGLES